MGSLCLLRSYAVPGLKGVELMADTDKQTLRKIEKLLDLLRELRQKESEIVEEVGRLAGGEEGIGVKLKRLERWFDAVWTERYAPGSPKAAYVWQYAKDVPLLKRLLRSLDVDTIEARMSAYLRDDDPFYRKQRHPFGLFSSNVNRYADAAAHSDLTLEPPADCKHTPACRSDQEHTRRRANEMQGGPF